MNEEILEYLAARRYGYRLLQRLLGTDPSEELIGSVDAEIAGQSFEIVTEFSGVDAGKALMDDVLARIAAAADPAELDRLATEYGRCFVGPFELPAPPFESVYRDRRRVLLTKTTLDVRKTYQASGFQPVLVRHVADDHVALELDFLAVLAEKGLDCAMAGNEAAAREYLKTSAKFIDAHLSKWMDAFAEEMHAKSKSAFYTYTVDAMVALVRADAAGLEKLEL